MKNLLLLTCLLFTFWNLNGSGTVTDDGSSFTWTLPGHDMGFFDWTTEPGGDIQGFQYWFYYRTGTDTREFQVPLPDNETYVGNNATLLWNNVGNKGFALEIVLTLIDGPGDGAQFNCSATVTNISGSSLDIDIFSLLDLDKPAAEFSNDYATLVGENIIEIDDDGIPGGIVCQFAGNSAIAFKVTETGGLNNLRTRLRGISGIDNLDNSGLPFENGDWIGAYQYSFSLTGNASGSFDNSVSVNQPIVPISTIPSMGEWALFILALMLLTTGTVVLMRQRNVTL